MTTAVSTALARYESLWSASVEMPHYPPLDRDLVTDVVVVGAGIAGMSVAYHLAEAGHSVVVLDDGPIGGGITSRTSAHLSCAMDNSYTIVESRRGAEITRLAAASHLAAIDRIEAIALAEAIDCDFERVEGFLFLPPGEKIKTLEDELEAARRAGAPVKRVPRAPLDFFDTGPCIHYANQAQFHPLKYLTGLARAIAGRGGRIFGGSHVTRIQGGKAAHVTAGIHQVHAATIVVATNAPVNDRVFMMTKMAPYMTYVIGARIPSASVPKGLYWDMDDPYHYVRVHTISTKGEGPHDILIVGGEDHKTGQAEDTERRHQRLERWARRRFPMIEGIEFRWAGQVMESVDGLAFIGPNPGRHDNIYIATGDTGMGMTHGTIAGILISDLISERPNPWADVYDPSRKPVRAAAKFLKENANVARQYLDWVGPGDEASLDDIPPGGGAIVRDGLKKVAAYRDARGIVHEFSAVCPHLGCIVQWNPTERTWDCPCHGSRFDKRGEVINGPSNEDLHRID
ncbi:MAG TPA: FAD-dependent oxidoreductase [Gemmatimonadales bacterium]|nr:FAD-dependent oxidoreductase [Gemmatimonadales bacterium]